MTRETDYGERYKLFVLDAPAEQAATPAETFGVGLEQEEDGRYAVVDLAWNGLAEQAGIDWGDYVTDVDVEQTDLPPKELIYPAGLALLGLCLLLATDSRTARRPSPRVAATAVSALTARNA